MFFDDEIGVCNQGDGKYRVEEVGETYLLAHLNTVDLWHTVSHEPIEIQISTLIASKLRLTSAIGGTQL